MIANDSIEIMTQHLEGLEQPNATSWHTDRASADEQAMVAVQRGSKDVLTKVLEARDVLDGRSLLEYAAVMGKREHVRVLARCLRWKVRMRRRQANNTR